jgi:hypothetical protein
MTDEYLVFWIINGITKKKVYSQLKKAQQFAQQLSISKGIELVRMDIRSVGPWCAMGHYEIK